MANDTHGLSQEDFRKMLQTPRAVPSSGDNAAGSSHQNKLLGKRRMQHRPPQIPAATSHFQPRKKRPQHNKPEKYRDRAAERREQGQSATSSAEMAAPAAEPSVLLEPAAGMATKQQQIYEQSKYLGGDKERTHLVKGLDYLLLEKQRLQAKATNEDLDEQLEKLETQATHTLPAVDDSAALKYHAQTSLGIKIVDILQSAAKLKSVEINELFVPGRMFYEFELAQAKPTAILCIRSKQEVLQMGEGVYSSDSVDQLVLSKVISAIAAAKSTAKQDTVSSLDCAGSPVNERVLDDADDDIFSDLSDEEVVVEPYPDSE